MNMCSIAFLHNLIAEWNGFVIFNARMFTKYSIGANEAVAVHDRCSEEGRGLSMFEF